MSHDASTSLAIPSKANLVDLGPNLHVEQTSSRGRGIFASADLAPGASLIATRPSVAVLQNQYLSSRCSSCFRSTPTGKHMLCSSCRVIGYCGATCQKDDWKVHKLECAALKEHSSRKAASGKRVYPDTPVRALGRLLWTCGSPDSDKWTAIKQMQSRELQTGSLAKEERFFQLSVALAHHVGQPLLASFCPTAADVMDLCSRFTSNCFSLTDPYLSNIGLAISPVVALLNHSCSPNAVVVYPTYASPSRQWMKVQAIRPIAKGEEVLTSYVDCAMPSRLRREQLRETYKFECDCALCETAAKVGDAREPLRCRDAECAGAAWMKMSPTREVEIECYECGTTQEVDAVEYRETVAKAEQAIKEAEELHTKDAEEARKVVIGAVSTLLESSFGFTLTSYPVPSALQVLLSISTTLKDWVPALRTATQAWTGVSYVFPHGHPVRSIVRTSVGKLMLNVGFDQGEQAFLARPDVLKECGKILEDAMDEDKIGFGEKEGVILDSIKEDMRTVQEGLAIIAARRGGVEDATSS